MNWLENLKRLKSSTNETYKSISEKTNIPQTTIEKLFSGRTNDPKLMMIRDVVHCLGYTLDDLLDDDYETTALTENEKKVLTKYRLLNELGKNKIGEYIDDLTINPKYIEQLSNSKLNTDEETSPAKSEPENPQFPAEFPKYSDLMDDYEEDEMFVAAYGQGVTIVKNEDKK